MNNTTYAVWEHMNLSGFQTFKSCMPQSACSFYHGYYMMSADMGLLILKLGVMFLVLDILHIFLKNFFEKIAYPFLKDVFRKEPKDLNTSYPIDI